MVVAVAPGTGGEPVTRLPIFRAPTRIPIGPATRIPIIIGGPVHIPIEPAQSA